MSFSHEPGFLMVNPNYVNSFGDSLWSWVLWSLGGMFVAMILLLWAGWVLSKPKLACSIYSGLPLRYATDISYPSLVKLGEYFVGYSEYDNRMFKIRNAAVCRETGRIFPDCVNWRGKISLNWNFLQKRYPGHYVSWGSLTFDQQRTIREAHETLEGFQTVFSSSKPAPRDVEPHYALAKPGPLYVDLNTKVLLGWKSVPDSFLEVLIVQKPKSYI